MEAINIQLSSLFEWLLKTTIQGSVLIGLILLVKVILRGRLPIRWHYFLWLLLLIRLAAPRLPQSRFSIFNLIPESLQTGRVEILPLLWLLGALVMAGIVGARNFSLWRTVRRERPITEPQILDLLEDCKMEMDVKTIVGVVVSDRVKSPVLFGFVRPRLLLPQGILEAYGLEELRYIFIHELAHFKQRDIYLGWLMALLQILHWFNPLMWFAFHRMRVDRELACDGLAVSRMNAHEPPKYGRTILDLFERFSQVSYMPSIAGILEDSSKLERRIKMIAKFKKTSRKRSAGAVLVLVALAYVTLTDAYSAQVKYGGGTGEQNDPYLIYTAEQMNAIGADANDWDKCFKLMADIDLACFTGTSFNIIGYWVDSGSPDNNPFTGVFDGNGHKISNFSYTSTDTDPVGLFGYVNGEINNLGLIYPYVDAGTGGGVGSLVGWLINGTITACYAEKAGVSGHHWVGGLVGRNGGTITKCYSTASVSGTGWDAGGLVGQNDATISNSYSAAGVSGDRYVGGLLGENCGTITDCYSEGVVSGTKNIGGLTGRNYYGLISKSYSTASVSGQRDIGGLMGANYGEVICSFWDIDTSGQSTSAAGTGLPTVKMQMQITFTDDGWDFTTPIWAIDEGVDYPRLWWETPVLHTEPELTLGTSNIISWDPVPGVNDYYAGCAEDSNFTSILYTSGWITETSFEFTGLQLGQRYWYSVKARNIAGIETDWSNVESSLQVTLAEAVEMMLEPESLKNENMKNALINKINAVQGMIAEGLYAEALDKLQNDILQKTDGCAETGQPNKNDWIITCEGQSWLYPLVIETIERVRILME